LQKCTSLEFNQFFSRFSLSFSSHLRDQESKPIGSIVLGDDVTVEVIYHQEESDVEEEGEEPEKYRFAIHTKEKTYYMISTSRADMERWVYTIMVCLRDSHFYIGLLNFDLPASRLPFFLFVLSVFATRATI
jgi:hypothetical protein